MSMSLFVACSLNHCVKLQSDLGDLFPEYKTELVLLTYGGL